MEVIRLARAAFRIRAAIVVGSLGAIVNAAYFGYELIRDGPAFPAHLLEFTLEHLIMLGLLPIFLLVGFHIGRVRWLLQQKLELEELLVRQNKNLQIVNAVARAARRSLRVEEAVNAALDEIAGYLPFEAVSATLLNKERTAFVLLAQRGLSEVYVAAVPAADAREEPQSTLLELGQAVVVKQQTRDPKALQASAGKSRDRTFAYLPIRTSAGIVGMVVVRAPASYDFDDSALETLQTAADEIGMAVENGTLYRELRESEEKHRIILDNAKDAIIRADVTGKLVLANRVVERVTGYSLAELNGGSIEDILGPGQFQVVIAMFEKLLHGEDLAPLQVEVHHRAGDRTFFELSAVPVVDDGHVTAVDFIGRDVTERVRAMRQVAALKDDLELAFFGVIASLATAIDAKDPHTRHHSDKVARYAEMLSQSLLPLAERQVVHYAAHLHDLGKIGVSDAVLRKTGPLNEDDWEEIRKHPVLGEKMIEPFAFFEKVRPIVRHHHERYDGKGYPDGLSGEAIPLGARILAVADAFEAMTSDRPYRKALSREIAVQELLDKAGTQFDPAVVETFLRLLDQFGDSLPSFEDDHREVPPLTLVPRDAISAQDYLGLFRILLHESPLGICLLDREFRLVLVNDFVCRLTGETSEKLIGSHCYDIAGEHRFDATRCGLDKLCTNCACQRALDSGQKAEMLHDFLPGVVLHVTAVPLRNNENEVIGCLELLEDVSSKVRDLATGAFNFGFFEEFLEQQCAASIRYGTPLSLLVVHLHRAGRSKYEEGGHFVHDSSLRAVTASLHSLLRRADAICRVGRNDFVIIAPQTSSAQAQQLVERIYAHLEETLRENWLEMAMGVASIPDDGALAGNGMRDLAERRLGYAGKRASELDTLAGA